MKQTNMDFDSSYAKSHGYHMLGNIPVSCYRLWNDNSLDIVKVRYLSSSSLFSVSGRKQTVVNCTSLSWRYWIGYNSFSTFCIELNETHEKFRKNLRYQDMIELRETLWDCPFRTNMCIRRRLGHSVRGFYKNPLSWWVLSKTMIEK